MSMGKQIDEPSYLRSQQYRDDTNLSARVRLHQRFSTNPLGWQRWLFDQMNIPDTAHVLELGCGRGDLWWDNRDRISPVLQITLTDFSPGMLASAQERLVDVLPGGRFEVVDAQEIPLDDNQMDIVMANHMLYHVPDRARAFNEIRRVLQSNGTFFAATNGRGHLQELDELLKAHAPEWETNNRDISFTLENGLEQLQSWFSEVDCTVYPDGLDVTEVEPVVEYVLSTRAKDSLNPERIASLREDVASRIAAEGVFHVTKRLGVFRCQGHA